MKKRGNMKIKNFEAFAKRVAQKLDTTIVRVSSDAIWFANYYYINFDGEFIYIADYSKDTPRKVMCAFIYTYNTQKDFFHDFDMMIAIKEAEPEETVKEVMEVKQELNARFGKEQYFDTDSLQPNKTISAKIENINHCPNQNTCCIVSPFVHCDYNYKSDSCIKAHKNFIHDCESLHKQMKAINNPNWHTVRLATVNSSDFFRLTEKLKLYISTYRELKQTLSYLRKCKSINTYDSCYVRYIKKQNDMYAKGKFTNAMLNYIRAKLSMQNVESGIWKSGCENATGYHDSRRYNKSRIDL